MTRIARVVWSEGMHLAQHHFQTQDRFFEESIRFQLSQLYSEPFGLSGSVFDAESLLNGVVSMTHGRGILPDGTPFSFPDGDDPPPTIDIRPTFSPTEHEQNVLLALPPLRPGAANLSQEGAPPEHRYLQVTQTLPDETTGLDEKPVLVGRKNFRLLLESEDLQDLVTLPVARIKRDGAGRFVYDPAFMGPCLQIGASPRLMEILTQLIQTLERKADTLSRERSAAGGSLAQYGGRELAAFWLSHAIHSGLATLRHHWEKRRSHPEELYVEMARLAGALCTFSLRSDPASIPRYDHTRLQECFESLNRHILQHLEVTLPTTSLRVPLQQRSIPSIHTGAIQDDMCSQDAQWVLGVRSEEKASRVVSAVVGKVKLASKADLPGLVRTSGMAGLQLEHLARPPRELAPRAGWEYFLIKRAGPLWKAIQDSKEIGIWVPEEIIKAKLELTVISRVSE
jgi:type VI secretion system protein ImpJ